ncbi:MAG: glycosyltransferase family 39 protein [Tepidisphaeraceae bacterium]
MGVILLLALAVRWWGIGSQSLWHDEVLTTKSATAPLGQLFAAVERNENKPPLYFFVMNLWVGVAGLGDVALRLPSAIFGVASVGVIFLLGRELFDERVGLVAALLLALSRFHISYSQEARTYSLMFLLMLLACWFAVRMIKRKSAIDQVGYVVSAALAMWAHPFAAFALLAMNVFYVACYAFGPRPATDLWRWIILQFAFSLAFWPWLSRTWRVVQTGLPWIVESTSFPQAMLSYAGSVMLFGLLIVLSLVAIGYGIARRERGILLLILLIILPILGPLAFTSRLYQTFIPRYGMIVVGAWLLLAAYGAVRLRAWATALLCAAYVAISFAHFRPGYGNYPDAEHKADVRAAAHHLITSAGAGDAVSIAGRPLFQLPLNHYLRGQDLRILTRPDEADPAQAPRLWVLYGLPEGSGRVTPPPGYEPVDYSDFDGVVLYQFAATAPVRTPARP